MHKNDIQALTSLDGLIFWKMSGSGNDFIILDNRQFNLSTNLLSLLARGLCARGFSVGADGLIALEPSNRIDNVLGKVDFNWHFFNADGSTAEMCGNGGRCAARFALEHGLANSIMVFDTLAGPIRAWVEGELVKLELLPPQEIFYSLALPELPKKLLINSINIGVPHVVIICEDLASVPVKELGRLIRFHQYFAPAGTNVNFVTRREKELWIRTYERGVEDETLACGTGAVASALIAGLSLGLSSPITVRVKSRESLKVYFKFHSGIFDNIFLEGLATYVYKGILHREAFSWL